MDRTHLMTVFSAVAEERSFAAAAQRLGMSRPTVTRAISSLEEHLGVKLILRTTRSVRLTDVGKRYSDDVKEVLAKIAEANEIAMEADSTMQGHVSVTAPALFGVAHVLPCIAKYLERFPAMGVSGYFLDRVVSIMDEGIDVAVRIGPLAESNLTAVRVGQVRRILCASPAYLDARGVPRHPDELRHHILIAATGVSPELEWGFRSGSENILLPITPRLTVASNDAAIQAAVMGAGVARLLSYQTAPFLKEGKLRNVLAEFEEEPWPIHVVYAESRYGSPKVKELVDSLVCRLRDHSHLDWC